MNGWRVPPPPGREKGLPAPVKDFPQRPKGSPARLKDSPGGLTGFPQRLKDSRERLTDIRARLKGFPARLKDSREGLRDIRKPLTGTPQRIKDIRGAIAQGGLKLCASPGRGTHGRRRLPCRRAPGPGLRGLSPSLRNAPRPTCYPVMTRAWASIMRDRKPSSFV